MNRNDYNELQDLWSDGAEYIDYPTRLTAEELGFNFKQTEFDEENQF